MRQRACFTRFFAPDLDVGVGSVMSLRNFQHTFKMIDETTGVGAGQHNLADHGCAYM